MIIVRLMGGLGNQMFQYAAGRRLALMHNVPLKLDLGWYDAIAPGDAERRFELPVFSIQADLARREDIVSMTGDNRPLLVKALPWLLKRCGLLREEKGITRERSLRYDECVLHLPHDAYLIGYWQSEKYFSDVEQSIRQEFTFIPCLSGKNLELAQLIGNTCSVSVHVRRGDYVSNPVTADFHGVCGVDFYQRCFRQLTAMVPSPHLFLFSDDPDWVRKHLKTELETTYVDHNGVNKGFEDMRLMSLCRHHIIANSSFSWWGAWLNPRPDKLVFAPRSWFKNTSINTDDTVPSQWVRL